MTEYIIEECDRITPNDSGEVMMQKQMRYLQKKEKFEKEQVVAKFLATPIEQMIPDIYEGKRAIPNCFLRSALFGMVRTGRRALVKNKPIYSMSQYQIFFSGEELDQNDLELWDTCIYLAKERKVNNQLRVTLYDLCKQMHITDAPSNRTRIINRLERLKTGTIKITTKKKLFLGSLINNVFLDKDGDGKLVVEYNKYLIDLFTDNDYTIIQSNMRHLLGENQLAKWLYGFYASHENPIPYTVEQLQIMCKSENSLKDFKYKLKFALEKIKKVISILNIKSKWDYEITDENYVIIYPNGKFMKKLNFSNVVKRI